MDYQSSLCAEMSRTIPLKYSMFDFEAGPGCLLEEVKDIWDEICIKRGINSELALLPEAPL